MDPLVGVAALALFFFVSVALDGSDGMSEVGPVGSGAGAVAATERPSLHRRRRRLARPVRPG